MNNEHFIPANLTAALVIQKGVHYDSGVNHKYCRDAPFECVDLKNHKNGCEFIDFTGRIFGFLKIVGLIKITTTTPCSGSWLAKCQCGKYTKVSTKFLKKPNILKERLMDRCRECKDFYEIKNKGKP